jgi:hypothetical protein
MFVLAAVIVFTASFAYSASQVRVSTTVSVDELRRLIYERRIQFAEWKGAQFTATLNNGAVVSATIDDMDSAKAVVWDQMFMQNGVYVRRKIQ